MKRNKGVMTFVAVILAFALVFSNIRISADAATSTVKSITVKNLPGGTLTLKAGKTFVLKTNVSAGALKFSTSNSRIVTVASGGKLKAVKNGKADITVSLKSNSKIKKTIKVTVGQPVTGVKLSKRTLTLGKGKSAVLRAAVQTSNASNKKLIWKSSNSKIVKVTSSGKIIALKGGSAVVIAIAADGSGKKASCKITVKVPVTAIKLSKSSGKMYVGSTYDLKAAVSPSDATNKKCSWTSSNEKVAMVSSAGRVVAVAAGSAVITAKAADGSGKKASFKVTVAKRVTITSASMPNQQTVKLTLSAAQKLKTTDFVVKSSKVLNGAYSYNMPIDKVTTKDHKTYTIVCNKAYRVDDGERVCVWVSNLAGTGKAKIETCYTGDRYRQTDYVSYMFEKDAVVNEHLSAECEGYSSITVKDLPAGIACYREKKGKNNILFKGSPKYTGTKTSTITFKDELGNVLIKKVTWNIYSSSVIRASYTPLYTTINSAVPSIVISRYVSDVAGGSGQYNYSIVGENHGLSVDSEGKVYGYATKPGTYNVKVKITDANDPAVSGTAVCEIYVAKRIEISGFVKDKNGKVIEDAYVKFVNKDKTTPYKNLWDSSFTELVQRRYSVEIVPGTYDVIITVGSDITYVYSRKFTETTEGVDFVSDVRTVEIRSNNSQYSADGIGNWTDDVGNVYGEDDKLYLLPGTYKLKANGAGKTGTITATVTDKTIYVTANIGNNTADFGDGTYVDAKNGVYYKFVPKITGTYYFYSITEHADPFGFLYGANMKKLANSYYNQHGLTNNVNDFCMNYNCEAGKTYYVCVKNANCRIYATMTNPGPAK